MKKPLTLFIALFMIASAFAQVAITPNNPDTNADLTCTLPGANPSAYMYKWYLNNDEQQSLIANIVPHTLTERLQQWKCAMFVPPTPYTGIIEVGEAYATIINSPPVASIIGFQNGNIGTIINFTGIASDPVDNDAVSYLWNFGDGTTAATQSASHAYAITGTFTVRFTATDSAGASVFDTRTISIKPSKPRSGTDMPRYSPVLPRP